MPITDPPTGDFALDGVYYVDYISDLVDASPDPDWSVESYWCTKPENISADDQIGDSGNCSWEWTFSADDVEGNPILRSDTDFIHPWRSWWRLRRGTTVISSGPVISTNTKLGEEII